MKASRALQEMLVANMNSRFRAGFLTICVAFIGMLLFFTGGWTLVAVAALFVFLRNKSNPFWLIQINKRMRKAVPLNHYFGWRAHEILKRIWCSEKPMPVLMRVEGDDIQAFVSSTSIGSVIILTEAALAKADDAELEALLAHECGHLLNKHHYMHWAIEALLLLMMVCGAIWLLRDAYGVFDDYISREARLLAASSFMVGIPFVSWVYTLVRRAMEWQADDYALYSTGQVNALARMLNSQLSRQPNAREIKIRLERLASR